MLKPGGKLLFICVYLRLLALLAFYFLLRTKQKSLPFRAKWVKPIETNNFCRRQYETVMKLLKDAAIILTLATLWFCSTYFAIYALFPFWALQCALINLIIALFGIALTNRSEAGSRLLYEGESDTEELIPAKIVIWILIIVPVNCSLVGVLWWLVRWLGLFGLN